MDDLTFAVVTTAVAIGALAYYVGLGILKAQANRRLTTLPRVRSQVVEDEGFAERAIAPIFTGLGRFSLRFTPVGWRSRTADRLRLAGLLETIDLPAWAAIKALSIGAALLVWLFVQTFLPGFQKMLALVLFLFFGFFAPDGLLNQRIEDRRKQMRNQLPDILDLLVISVEAGLGFDSALSRVVETVPGEMSEEFKRMLAETRVGVSRRDAMRHLANRTDVDELDSFLLAMGQADTFGISVSRVLRVQADEMRAKRRQRAQERALSAPVKMVFPLVFCIFPALFVLLLGPAAIQVWENIINR